MKCWMVFFFFKQKTAYEMRISDWSSDVCSSDLKRKPAHCAGFPHPVPFPRKRGKGDRVGGSRPGCIAAPLRTLASGPPLYLALPKTGRATWRERVCLNVLYSVGAVSLKKNKQSKTITSDQQMYRDPLKYY